MEQSEAVAAEVGPVVIHLQRVANGVPLVAVQTVGKCSLVCQMAEVGFEAEVYLTSAIIHLTSFYLFPHSIVLPHGLVHDYIVVSIFLLNSNKAIAILEACQSGDVAVFHLRDIYEHLALTGRSIGALSQCVAGITDVVSDSSGLQSQPPLALREAPALHVGHVVPLPYGTEPPLALVTQEAVLPSPPKAALALGGFPRQKVVAEHDADALLGRQVDHQRSRHILSGSQAV